MGTFQSLAIAVLLISFFTFVAFFGRLPGLRNTPVGTLHRVLWIYMPRALRAVDLKLTNGQFSAWVTAVARTMWNDRHPVVMIFFILILFVSECMFLPPAWILFSVSRKIKASILILLPYIFLYLSATTDPGYISLSNISHQMTYYPFDYTIFHPGQTCRTCKSLKPARSKHCSICKHCISKLDHHCIFINNCVGYNNQHFFLLLLLCTAMLTTYGTFVGTSLLSSQIHAVVPSWTFTGKRLGLSWGQYFNVWAWAMQGHTRIGSISLLCLLTSPLIWGLLGYHIYLIWAGTTTNESMKWSDWRAEISDGYVFKRKLGKNRHKGDSSEVIWTRWPVESEQILLRTEDGQPPSGPHAIGIGEWQRVWRLRDVENLYDLGFWDNAMDVFLPRAWLRWGER